MSYVIQGLWSDNGLVCEENEDVEEVAISKAKRLLADPTFEGESVRVITSDGELVWDSEEGKCSHENTYVNDRMQTVCTQCGEELGR